MRENTVLVGAFLLLCGSPAPCARADVIVLAEGPAVAGLRCEYRAGPLGIDSSTPRLSWVLESAKRGVVQSAYRVLVASNAARLAADEGDLWDSGKVVSSESAQVAYAGARLASRMQCHWKVMVWDGRGDASAWSAPARWTMGLLDRSEWRGEWIGAEVAPEYAARGRAGAKVTLRFAEMRNPDGTIYTTNLRGAKCTDTYVLKGGGEEVWEPRFTFHGFQYVEVSGYPGTPPPGMHACPGRRTGRCVVQ